MVMVCFLQASLRGQGKVYLKAKWAAFTGLPQVGRRRANVVHRAPWWRVLSKMNISPR